MGIKLLFITICLFFSVLGFAQDNNETYTLNGKVVEGKNVAMPFVNVLLKSTIADTLIIGVTTDIDGKYSLRTNSKNVYLEISYIGYETYRYINIKLDKPVIQIPNIKLVANNIMIDDVDIIAEKSSTEFKLDKRVFNVGKDLTTSGSSALEVLNNVPSVNVSIEGDVSLRGTEGVQILINGKPSILTDDQGNALGTITADMISKIEVMTNPSAKYEAEGSSGIINIILKKEEKKGVNGSVSINTGIPDNHSIGFSISRRGEKFNVFSQLGAGYRSLPRYSKYINQDLVDSTTLYSEGTNYRNEQFYNFVLGTDYNLTKNDVITLSGSFAYEIEEQPSSTDFLFINSTDAGDSKWTRNEETEATNPKYQYELKYKKDFKNHKEHDLLFSLIGNFFGKDQSSLFSTEYVLGENPINNQKTRTNFNESKNTINIDYTRPLNKQMTIETGAQYLLNDVSNDYEVTDEIAGVYIVDEGLTNTFEYHQDVLGVYGTLSYEKEKWGVKAGLRVEQTDLSTLLINTNEKNQQQFIDFFPSFHTSYKYSDRISFQAGYSRRIFRPRLWDLNPFFNISNNFNIRTGNPKLLPEYTDSYEIGSIFLFEKISFNINIYDKYTTQIYERVSVFENGVNTFRPENLGTRNTTGAEFNFKYRLSKKLSFNGDSYYSYFIRKGSFDEQVFDFTADRWMTKLTGKVKFNKKFEVEVSGQLHSGLQTIQGKSSGIAFANIGMRYKILKGKGVFNANVRDIFSTRFRETVVNQADYYLYSKGQRGRFITLGFSYGFGKGEAMQYSGRRR